MVVAKAAEIIEAWALMSHNAERPIRASGDEEGDEKKTRGLVDDLSRGVQGARGRDSGRATFSGVDTGWFVASREKKDEKEGGYRLTAIPSQRRKNPRPGASERERLPTERGKLGQDHRLNVAPHG